MDSLQPEPTIEADGWAGYQHFTDPTLLPINVLTYPSQNCSMPSRDKIVPDLAKKLLGQKFTQNVDIMGNMEKFTTMGGVEIEARVFKSQQYVNYTVGTGVFAIGETITGGSSSSTAMIISKGVNLLILSNVSGAFTIGETITGATSTATGTVTIDHTTFKDVIEVLYTDPNPTGAFYNIPYFYQITENVNPLALGLHRYSFSQWFDTNLDPSKSLNLSRMIWVNGNSDIYSWTGGIASIASIVTNTSITLYGTDTWASLGFVDPTLGGSGNIIINGKVYAITGGWSTTTLTLTDTTGITVGNLAFSQIQQDATTIPFDFCKQTKGYMYYGQWKSRQQFQSNAYSRPYEADITSVQANQNDLVVANSPYTGTAQHIYRVTIDSINPSINQQTFTGVGYNDAVFRGSGSAVLPVGYTGTPGVLNIYKVTIVADTTIIVATPGTAFAIGETITVGAVGSETAFATIVKTIVNGGNTELGVVYGSGTFYPGDTVKGTASGTTATIGSASPTVPPVFAQTWIQYSKNGVITSITSGLVTNTTVPVFTTGNITLTDGLIITFVNYFGHVVGDVFELDINQGGADTFQWQIDGAAPAGGDTLIPITGSNQILSDGLEISFTNINGHTLGDYWEITVNPDISGAWHNFYFTLPTRRPGEGYIFRLPSNFWTMDTQEDKLYINTQYGEWSVIDTVLSSDLISETVSLTPLKQSGALKVIDPWMTGHIEDDLMFVTLDKSLMAMGRQAFLQEVQDGYLSDAVKYDFLPCSFIGGSMKYIGKRFYISSPEQAITHCYDMAKKYWQPPKTFSEMGILSIVGNQLICHSNIRNQSFTVFDSVSDNGGGYLVLARTSLTPYFKLVARKRIPARWDSKYSSNSFIEGYVTGNPQMVHTVFLGVNDSVGKSHIVEPVISNNPTDTASIGEGALATHPLGNDLAIQGSYFNEIYRKYSPLLTFYFIAIQMSCVSKNHSYSYLTLGMNMSFAPTGNNSLIGDREVL